MGLLDALMQSGESVKRKARGLLDDPRGTLGMLAAQLGEDAKAYGDLNHRFLTNAGLKTMQGQPKPAPLSPAEQKRLYNQTMNVVGMAPVGMVAVKGGGLLGKLDNTVDMSYQIDHKPMNVQGGASTLDDLSTAFGDDIYGPNALRYFGSGDPAEKRILKIMQGMRGKPNEMVTIYRGVPANVGAINPGDWVTLDRQMAQLYANPEAYGGAGKGVGKVIEMQVPANHITSWPDSLLEFGYYPPK